MDLVNPTAPREARKGVADDPVTADRGWPGGPGEPSKDALAALAEQGIRPVLSCGGAFAAAAGFRLNAYEMGRGWVEQPPLTEHIAVFPTGGRAYHFRGRTGGRRLDAVNFGPGSLFLLPAHEAAKWEHLDERMGNLHVQFAPSFLEGVAARDAGGSVGPVELMGYRLVADPQAAWLAGALRAEVEGGGAGGRLFAEGVATALAARLLRGHSAHPLRGAEPRPSACLSPAQLRRALDHLNDHLAEDVSLVELTVVAAGPGGSLSPNHFALLFRRSTGLPPHRYVIQQRVERARTLLVNRPDLSLAEVALACGFYDQAHMTNAVKRALGVTPGQVRGRA